MSTLLSGTNSKMGFALTQEPSGHRKQGSCRSQVPLNEAFPASPFLQWFVIWSTGMRATCDHKAGKGTNSQENWNLPSEADNDEVGSACTGCEAYVQ